MKILLTESQYQALNESMLGDNIIMMIYNKASKLNDNVINSIINNIGLDPKMIVDSIINSNKTIMCSPEGTMNRISDDEVIQIINQVKTSFRSTIKEKVTSMHQSAKEYITKLFGEFKQQLSTLDEQASMFLFYGMMALVTILSIILVVLAIRKTLREPKGCRI